MAAGNHMSRASDVTQNRIYLPPICQWEGIRVPASQAYLVDVRRVIPSSLITEVNKIPGHARLVHRCSYRLCNAK